MKLKKHISDMLLTIIILLAIMFVGIIMLYVINNLSLATFRGLLSVDTLLILIVALVLVRFN